MSQQTADELRRGLEAVLSRVQRLRSPLAGSEDVADIADTAAEWADAANAAASSAGAAVPLLSGGLPALARCGRTLPLLPADFGVHTVVCLSCSTH